MKHKMEDMILQCMQKEAAKGRIIMSVPDLMRALKISRPEARASLAVLETKKLVQRVPMRDQFWFLTEIYEFCKERWGDKE